LADFAILWQGVSVFICPDRPPRFASAHAIDRTMVVASSSETELNFANYRVGVSSAAWVNRFIVRVVSVTVRIIAIGIVSVVRVGIIKEWVPKITEEEESIVEAAIVEPTAAKATIMKAAATKATAVKGTVKPATAKATASAEAAAMEATASTEAAAVTATTTAAMRRHVRDSKSTNCDSNCHCNKFVVIHMYLSIC
jgi:hypothetical protein